MTTSNLIKELSGVSWKLGTEKLPVKINGNNVDIVEITLEGKGDNQYCNIIIKEIEDES